MRTSNPFLFRWDGADDTGRTAARTGRPVGATVGGGPADDYITNPYALGADASLGAGKIAVTLDDVVVRTATTLGTVVLTAVLSTGAEGGEEQVGARVVIDPAFKSGRSRALRPPARARPPSPGRVSPRPQGLGVVGHDLAREALPHPALLKDSAPAAGALAAAALNKPSVGSARR
ncbi:hypothetical protein V2W30_40275 (plasmid) [Streptomyces sp. Q6]|uniref:Uncharacterized protein n=1 Tax=Streptomyces citrinus TaxID=3118173 RepID=A0ACD5AQU9_9ACTN